MEKEKKKIGIVLSGGAARGYAHIGVLKALNEAGIYPDIISAVSAGALIGALYADGNSPDDIISLLLERKMFDFATINTKKHGLLKFSGLVNELEEHLNARKFEDLKIPMIICATNFKSGVAEYFDSGDIIRILVASSSIPVLFSPVKINDNYYMDGGIVDNMPLHPLMDCCHKLIGVHVNPIGQLSDIDGLMGIAVRSFHISIASEIINTKKNKFDIYIEPPALKNYGIMNVSSGNEMYHIGYEYARSILKDMDLEEYKAST